MYGVSVVIICIVHYCLLFGVLFLLVLVHVDNLVCFVEVRFSPRLFNLLS